MKREWWHGKIAYQIYPKSFADSNGDGIGDIRGILSKLDYLQDLGVDIIWLSPIYKTPFIDQGYDISDYYDIDPMYGSLADMDDLLLEAKKRHMYIVMDLVVNHCSSEHIWFKKAMEDLDGEYGKYFIIKDGKDGNPPNNWRSYFGGSVWERIADTNRYYLHLFAKEQPDLNWENPRVVEEIYKNINWWLDRGVSGFRVDAIVNIKKEATYADLPLDGLDQMADCRKMLPYATGLIEQLKDMNRNTFRKYDAFSVAELFNYDAKQLEEYIGEDGCFSTIFDFSTDLIDQSINGWYDRGEISPNQYRDAIFESTQIAEGKGYMCSIIENHDEPRGVSRYLPEDARENIEAKKVLATIFMMRKGLPFFYQGQEIGMTNTQWDSIDEIDDISTHDQYHVALLAGKSEEEAMKIASKFSRDNARTPMQWSNKTWAGFSTVRPWIKVNANYIDINVEAQIADDASVLNYYKKLIQLRKSDKYKETILYGTMKPVYEDRDGIFAFYREADIKIVVITNMQDKEIELPLYDTIKGILVNTVGEFYIDANKMILKPYQSVVLEVI